jgi:threonine aldolase
VVLFDPKKAWEFELRRKRGGHLFSKHRYLAAQIEAYLTDDLWRDLATHANAMATRLSQGILSVEGAKLTHPTEANCVFASWPRGEHRKAQDAGAQYYLWPFNQTMVGPDDENVAARLVCSWSTTEADVDQFLETLK